MSPDTSPDKNCNESAGGKRQPDDEGAFAGHAAFSVPDGVEGVGFWVVAEEEVELFAGMDFSVIADLYIGQLM